MQSCHNSSDENEIRWLHSKRMNLLDVINGGKMNSKILKKIKFLHQNETNVPIKSSKCSKDKIIQYKIKKI